MKTIIKKTAGKTAKIAATLFVVLGLIFSSCKKGDTGPTGATGATGNANVQSQTFLTEQFTFHSSTNDYEISITDSQITQSVLNSGLISSYITISGVSYQLPVSSLQMDVEYNVGQVIIKTTNSSVQGTIYPVKVVVIPTP